MKNLSIRLRISVQISVLLFAIANLNAQLQEIGSLEGYRSSSAIKLNDAVLISTDGEYSSRENFFTKDFKNFVPAVASNILRGSFNLKDHSYLVLRHSETHTLHYLLRVNENLSLDTVTQINLSEEGRFKLLDQQSHYAYFGIGEVFFRFNETTQSIERISVDVLGGLSFSAYKVFTTDEAFYVVRDHIYRLAKSDTTFSKGLQANDPLYSRLELHPKIKLDSGVLVTFYRADSLHYRGILQGDSAITQTKALPPWPDPSFKVDPISGNTIIRINKPKASGHQSYIMDSRGKWRANGEYVAQVRWYYFDTLTNDFSITKDTHSAHQVEARAATFKLNKGTVAFSMYKNKGLELVKLHPDSLELLRDNFTGMASGIGKNDQSLVLDGKLYYMATHPYYGHSLHRTDGSPEGTGVLASLEKKFKSSRLISIGSKIYLIGSTPGLPGKVFEVPKDGPFLQDKYSQNSTGHWNQSIYSNLYYQTGFGPGSYDRPKMKTKNGLILSSTSSHSEGDRFFPEEELESPYHERTNNSWHLTKTYALYDTSGNLLIPGYVRGYWGTEQLALAPDTTILTFFRHKDFSYTNFDTLDYAGDYNYFKAYSFNGSVKWSHRLSSNFEVMDMEADDEGNLVLVGKYEEGGLSFLNEHLYSPYNIQYFVAKIDASGNLQWAVNCNMEGFSSPTDLAYLDIEERSDKIHLLISEGSHNVASSCRYRNWLSKVMQINATTGNIDWSQNLETTDLAVYYGITTTPLGEVWVAGWFRGEYLNNGEIQERAYGEDCPKNGLLICLDKNSGKYKKSITNQQGSYGTVHATDESIYTLWYSYDRILNKTEYSGDWATTIEQRDLSGIVKAAYQFPSNRASGDNFFQLQILENSEKDWLMFSGAPDGYLISDSLYQVGMSLDRNSYNAFLMRRSGQIFRDLTVTQPIATEADNPFSIYPNPAHFHEVFIRASSDEEPFTKYQLTSLDGRVVASGTIGDDSFPQYIQFPTRLRGLFLLHLYGNGTPQTFKLHL